MTNKRGALIVGTVLALTMVQMIVGVAGGFPQFNGKGFVSRIIAYPLLMLALPAFWWWRNRGTGRTAPWGAWALIMMPFLIDVTGNTLNLYDTIEKWDDANHFFNWFLLSAGIGLLVFPTIDVPWRAVLTIVGIGALLAVGWELGEWYTFIRRGVELDGAYQDTLSDEALGTTGALLAGLVVVWWRVRSEGRDGSRRDAAEVRA